MQMLLRQKLRDFKLALGESAGDMSTPEGQRRAWWHFMIFDHGALRVFWTNFAEIAPNVFRANQPSPTRFAQYAKRGLTTILNLRGASRGVHYQFEAKACTALGLKLIDIEGLAARKAPKQEALVALLDTMKNAPKPFILHCKSGADRTSLAAAIYLLAIQGASIADARLQFSPRFIHFKWTKTGVLDHILDTYEIAHKKTGISFEDWLRTEYDGAAIQDSFNRSRR